MQFTTTSHRGTNADNPLGEGLRLAIDFLRQSHLPSNVHEELQIVAALRVLQRNEAISAADAAKRDELYRAVERITNDDQVSALIQWIRQGGTGWQRFLRSKKTRQRYLLLFVALAKVVAPVSRFVIIPALSTLRVYPNREMIASWLSWMPSWFVWGSRLHLACAYLEFVHELWLAGPDAEESGVLDPDVATFGRWDWQRRLLVLISRRARRETARSADTGASTENPVFASDTLEFQLALKGQFRSLKITGGRISGRVLRRLGYRDGRRDLPIAPIVPLLLAVGIGFTTLWVLSSTAAGLILRDAENRRFVRDALETIENDSSADILLPHTNLTNASPGGSR